MKTKHHYSTFLIALILGLMMTTGAAWAQDQDTEKPTIDNPKLTLSSTETHITVEWQAAKDNKTPSSELEYFVYISSDPFLMLVAPHKRLLCTNDQEGPIKGSDATFSYTTNLCSDTHTTLKELEPGTSYLLVVAVCDKAGNVSYYNNNYLVKIDTKGGKLVPIIRLSKSEITMDAEGGTDGFTLTTNQNWNRDFHPREAASYVGGWIKISGPDGLAGTGEIENKDFTIEVYPNTSTEDRTATITFWMSEVSSSITVKQKGKVAADPEPKPEPGPSETVLVSSVMLDQPKVSIDGDRASFQLKASVLPANATNSELQWSSSNPSVASVEAASTASLLKAGVTGKAVTVHIHKKGKAEITAQAMDGSGKSASCQVNVLSTVGNIEAAATRIYASGGTLRLTLPQAAVVRIYNVSGALVHMLNASAGDTSVALSAGVYVVRVGDTVQKVRIE